MITDYYYDIEIYREVSTTDDWGNSDDQGNWQLSGTIQGFIQSRGGSYAQANQANSPLSSHIMYTDIGVDIEPADRAKKNDKYYRLDFEQNGLGISGMLHHQEIAASILNDLS